MRDYDPQLDTIERWGEEAMNAILESGQVDDWSDPIEDGTRKSLLQTIGQQGVEIEQLMIEREDLKSKNDKLRALNNRARLACILFGSAVLILSWVMIV